MESTDDFELYDEWMRYDSQTGELFWKRRPSQAQRVGDKIGYQNPAGYVTVKFKGKLKQAHRIVWLLNTGHWPKDCIDHINRIKSDNRFENLRDVTHSTNNRNTKVFKGGVIKRINNWEARIHRGKARTLGRFETKELAEAAYQQAILENP